MLVSIVIVIFIVSLWPGDRVPIAHIVGNDESPGTPKRVEPSLVIIFFTFNPSVIHLDLEELPHLKLIQALLILYIVSGQ
jgi:hypothetical protein